MSGGNGYDPSALIRDAHIQAEQSNWIKAAALSQRALDTTRNLVSPDIASLIEFQAKCNFKGAFEAGSRREFKELMDASAAAWTRAHAMRETFHEPAFAKRDLIGAKTADFWTQDDARARVRIAKETVDLSTESLTLFDQLGKNAEALETRLTTLGFIREIINLQTNYASLRNFFDQALELGRTALEHLRRHGTSRELVETLGLLIWYLALEAEIVLPPPEFESLAEETRAHSAELGELARTSGTQFAQCLSLESEGHVSFDIVGNPAAALASYEESLATANHFADSLVKGRLQYLCSQAAFWLGHGESDPGKKRHLFEKGKRFATDSIASLSISFQTTELSGAHTVLARCLVGLANLALQDFGQRKQLLDEASKVASAGTSFESETWGWSRATNALANVLYFLSKIEKPDRKMILLKEALHARERIVNVNDQLSPHFWNNVIAPYNLALIRAEIADSQDDPDARKKLLTQAALEMELCLQRGKNWGTNPGFRYRIAEHDETYAEILSRLYKVTNDQLFADKAVKSYYRALAAFQESNNKSNVGAIEWKIAKIHNDLQSYQLAADDFKNAAADYRKAVAQIPGSAPLFEDLARYLDAWSIIESARLHHDEGEYLSASRHYLTASKLLTESRGWSFLSPLFLGRSHLEKGEGESAEENHSDATESFRTAIDEFRKETEQLEEKLREIESAQDRRELEDWLEIARQREKYCHARLELEEARLFDEKDDRTASATKFRSSSETLSSLSKKTLDNQERTELEGLARFCEGWALMKEADAEASPEKYSEAAESFLKLRSSQTKEQLLFLALANAAICKALGAGTVFQQTRDVKDYADLKRQTEAAADYFRQAGFKKTEAWTRATQRLYDALIFVTDAESEHDPTRKTELYHQAENHLRIAAQLYGEAGFPAKKEDATSQLQRIMEEKRVLLAPLEALSQIPTATASSLTLSPRGRGQPIGAQRFDEAYVVGDVNIQHREVSLGSTFTVDLEIANVGKSSATLVKLQNALSEGLEPVGEPGTEVSSNGEVNLLGRTLEHLKTHVIKIQTRANRKGEIQLRPRLFYADDSGEYKTYQFSPTILTVLDIGPPVRPIATAPPTTPSVTLGAEFRFETGRSREVFQRLVREFLLDYMSKRLYVEKAGWRSLVQIIRDVKIPRSSLYGPRGRDGPVLVELERRGLIESRIFPKERGRGGAVKKIRVAYDNEIVKRLVEQMVVDNSGR